MKPVKSLSQFIEMLQENLKKLYILRVFVVNLDKG